MSGRGASRIAWSSWTVCVVVVGVLRAAGPMPSGLSSDLASVFFILAFATTGAFVASRRPANPIGWLLCASALTFAVGGVAEEISDYAVREHREGLGVAVLAAWVGSFVWAIGVGLSATFLLLLFPNGRLPSSRWRPVAWLAGASLTLVILSLALNPGPIEDTGISNPLGLPGIAAVLNVGAVVGFVALIGSLLASVTSLIVRFRQAGREERQQLKWIAYATPLLALGVAASIVVESISSSDAAINLSNSIAAFSLAVIPVAIGIAMLRHRLYDIDVVINRTLVYGALTATLGLTYLVVVLLLQLALSPVTEDSGLAVAASTLAVAALFRPARARIQALVDRRFYRRKYDAVRILEGFTARRRDEVDLDALAGELRGVISQTVQPAHLSLWLRGPEARR